MIKSAGYVHRHVRSKIKVSSCSLQSWKPREAIHFAASKPSVVGRPLPSTKSPDAVPERNRMYEILTPRRRLRLNTEQNQN